MTDRDPLDDLLTRSAPASVQSTPSLHRDLALLSREARSAEESRRRPTRLLVGAGLSLLLLGGAGTAVAATTFNWAPWAEDPDIAYPFTLPSGRECEARVLMLLVTDAPETGPISTTPDATLSAHFRSFDAIAASDIESSIAEVRSRAGSGMMVAVSADGQLSDVHETAEGPTADDVYAAAAHDALGDALRAEAIAYGLGSDQWSSEYDIQCEAVSE